MQVNLTQPSASPYWCQVRPYAAEYLGQFVARNSGGGFINGSQWLVWKFESDATLADAISGGLGPFPVGDCRVVCSLMPTQLQ